MKKLLTLAVLSSAATFSVDARPYVGQRFYNQDQSYGDSGYYYDQNLPDCGSYYQQGYYGDSSSQYQPYQQYPQYSQESQKSSYQSQNNQSSDRDKRVVSDDELTGKIRDAIGSGWFSKGYENIKYNVNNGYVTLRGTVENQDDKTNVEDKVRKINGVRQVNNEIVVSGVNGNNAMKSDNAYRSLDRSYRSNQANADGKYPQDFAATEEDRHLNDKIRNKLSDGWLSKGNETLVIKTTNGFVVIQGTVDKLEDSQKINDKLKDIEGIKGLQNQVRVRNQ